METKKKVVEMEQFLEEEVVVGEPTLEGAKVTAEVLAHDRTKKITVFKRKRRKGYRRKQGHRRDFTRRARCRHHDLGGSDGSQERRGVVQKRARQQSKSFGRKALRR